MRESIEEKMSSQDKELFSLKGQNSQLEIKHREALERHRVLEEKMGLQERQLSDLMAENAELLSRMGSSEPSL